MAEKEKNRKLLQFFPCTGVWCRHESFLFYFPASFSSRLLEQCVFRKLCQWICTHTFYSCKSVYIICRWPSLYSFLYPFIPSLLSHIKSFYMCFVYQLTHFANHRFVSQISQKLSCSYQKMSLFEAFIFQQYSLN